MIDTNSGPASSELAALPRRHTPGLSPMTLLLLGLVVEPLLHRLAPLGTLLAWPWNLLGAVPLSAGLALLVLGERRFRAAGTPVRPDGDPAVLVDRGVFAWTRNPMYLGIVVLLVGSALLLGSLSTLAVAPAVARLLARRFVLPEEARLRAVFGAAYEEYARSTPRWLGLPAWARRAPLWRRLAGSALVAICLLYAGFALAVAIQELLAQVGLAQPAKPRALPGVFAAHALAGGVVLLGGPLQFNGRLRRRWPALHRVLGRLYVLGVGVSSLAGLRAAISFDVAPLAKLQFVLLAALWLGSTALATLRVVRGDLEGHRDWMTRSFALSLFFLSFSVWPAATAALGLPQRIAYPLAQLLAWGLNLAVAEIVIRRRREETLRLSAGGRGA